ncbi:Transcription factor MYB98 [Linum perenne]
MPQNKYNTMITIPNNHNSLPFDSSTIFPNQPQPLQMNHSFGPNGLLSNQVFGVNTWSNLNSYEAFPCESSSSNMRHNNADVSDKNAHEMGTNNQVMNTVTPENTVTKKTSKDRNLDFMKSQWTPEEDSLLVQLVEKYGLKKWAHIARILSGRVGKQCRERWYNYLKPDIKREIWTEDEDKILINSHMKFGNKWSEIAKTIPGRTENSIKNHWNATRRRHISNYRFNKNTQSTLLYDYIKSLNLDNLVDHGSSTSSSSTAPAAEFDFSNEEIPTAAEPPLITTHQEDSFLPLDDQQLMLELGGGNDGLVPEFDFSNEEIPDLGCIDEMFQDDYNLESLLDGFH